MSEFFNRNFKYSLWQDIPPATNKNETPLSRFLLHTRSGHCEYFATATALLLRELHVPARYAVGYAVHEMAGHKYVVRERDAHAWCIVWNQKAGVWQNFDTTPGSWVADEEQHASPLQFLSDSWSWIQFQIAKFRWGQSQVQQYVLWALIPVLGLLLYLIIFRSSRRRHRQSKASPEPVNRPGLDSEFYRLEQRLVKRGLPRPPGEPLSVWLGRALLEQPELAELKPSLFRLLRLHYRHRFDPLGLNQNDRETLHHEVETCLADEKW